MRLVASTALGVLVAMSLGAAETPKTEAPKSAGAKSGATTGRPNVPGTTAPAAPAPTPPARTEPPKPSPALEKWIDLCVENLASDDSAIKNGAVAALRVAGPAAQPRLVKASTGDNPKIADVAKRLLADTQRQEVQAVTREKHAEERKHAEEKNAQIAGLKLTEEQRPKVAKIFGDYRTKQDEITQSARKGELPREQATAKLAALRADMDKQLATVLSAEQLKQYQSTKQPDPGVH